MLNLVRGVDRSERHVAGYPFPAPRKEYDVVFFPIIDWDYLFQRPQQLASQFAGAGYRVFYIHTTFHQSGGTAFVRRLRENAYRIRMPGSNEPRALYSTEMAERMIETGIKALDVLREQAGIQAAVSIAQIPFWTPLVLAARERWGWNVVYDCMDDHAGFSGSSLEMLKHEERLILDADLVTATSRLLFDRVSKGARRTLLLPNGADFEHFADPGASRPLDGIARPIIGYYGAISEWLDVEMIRSAALAHPEWNFVLVGDSFGVDLRPLKLRNIHILGRRPYGELPSYLHQFDVACIPFRITPLTQATNPVKFYEYLSTGKPVVATALPELEPYAEHYYPVRAPGDFISQIEAALGEAGEEKRAARVQVARNNTWRERFASLRETVRELSAAASL